MQEPKLTLKNMSGHLKTVNKHKWEVAKACFKAGLYWQGIIHDFSKYSPAEFINSARYYQGNSSPIDAEKKEKGYSFMWLHHRGRNPHHWEYWVDGLSRGGVPVKIPVKYVTEMICDFIAAGKVYLKDKWNFSSPLAHTSNAIGNKLMVLHPKTQELILAIENDLAQNGFVALKKSRIKALAASMNYENTPNVDSDELRAVANKAISITEKQPEIVKVNAEEKNSVRGETLHSHKVTEPHTNPVLPNTSQQINNLGK